MNLIGREKLKEKLDRRENLKLVMVEPEEDWMWYFVDETLVQEGH